MKKILIIVLLFFGTFYVFSQSGEFKTYPNGLIYNEETMNKLEKIVDSLNLKFKVCNFNQNFHAKSQAIGHIIQLDTGNIVAAKKDIENNIPFEEFVSKYPSAKIVRQALFIKDKVVSKKQDYIEIEHFDLLNNYGYSIRTPDSIAKNKDFAKTWMYSYTEKSKYSSESIYAFYFPENFQNQILPQKYSLMIGYSDCLIDTTTTKFKANLEAGWVDLPRNWQSMSHKKQEKLLDEMRGTRVIGGCSMDSRPREHAMNIALLSAETAHWEVFLKAHLDIMNDRFERMSDGSYAYGARQTYIKELEELNINVKDLLLGISFRLEDPVSNHYFGSVSRLGRALAETNNPKEIEAAILTMVQDKQLDYYNRLIFYFLFKNYNFYLNDENTKKENQIKLQEAAKSFPEFFSQILLEKQ